MTGVLIRRRHCRDTDRRKPCENGGRDGSDAVTGQGSMALPTLWFWILGHQNYERINGALSHPVCGTLLHSPSRARKYKVPGSWAIKQRAAATHNQTTYLRTVAWVKFMLLLSLNWYIFGCLLQQLSFLTILMIFIAWNTDVSFSQKMLFHFPPSFFFFFFLVRSICFRKLAFFCLGIALVYYSSFVTDCFWVLLLRENCRSCKRGMWQIWHSVTPTRLPVFWGKVWRKQHESTSIICK